MNTHDRFWLKGYFKNQYIKYIVITILAFLNNIAFAYAKSLGDAEYSFLGTHFWGYNPTSLIYYAVCVFLLNRAFNRKTRHDFGKIILSVVFGFLISLTFIWGNARVPNLMHKHIGNGLQEIKRSNFLPFGTALFDSLYGEENRRYEIISRQLMLLRQSLYGEEKPAL